jgi:hypothetical protein
MHTLLITLYLEFVIIAIMRFVELFLEFIFGLMGLNDIHEDKLDSKSKRTVQANLLSSITAGLIAYISISQQGLIINTNGGVTCDIIRSHEKFWLTPIIMMAHFVYDACFHKITIEFLFHHTVGFIALLLVVTSDSNYGIYFANATLIVELSTIILNLIFVTSDLTKTIMTVLFAIVFTLVRPVYMALLLSKMIECGLSDLSEKVSFVAFLSLYILNLYWFVFICKKVWCTIFKIKQK